MPPLLHDRFLMLDPANACDLATGDLVPIEGLADRRPARDSSLPDLLEVLDHGRDGAPRSIAAAVPGTSRWTSVVDAIASAAVDRGYLPVDVGLYARLRQIITDEITSRTLLLIATDRSRVCGSAALIDAATHTPRAHVLLTLRAGRSMPAPQVREARAVYRGVTRPRAVGAISTDVLQQVQRSHRAPEFIAAGRHAAAERLLRDVAASLLRRTAWPQAVEALIVLGRLLLERGRSADAVRVFGEAIAVAGTAADEYLAAQSRIWLATARTDAGELTAAESVCRALLLVGGLPAPLAAWARAVLVRVLLWQDRTRDALDLAPMPDDVLDDLDADTRAFVGATRVRLLLHAGRGFDAGLAAGDLVSGSEGAPPLVRLVALTSQLRVLTDSGHLIAAEERLREIARLARRARAPLRLLRARVIWFDALRRSGRSRDADRELRTLSRLAGAAPPLLRHGIEQRARMTAAGHATSVALSTRVMGRSEAHVSAADLVRLVHEEDDDRTAIDRVLEATASQLHCVRVDVWSADAGPATVVRSSGSGLPSTIGGRVIEAGIVIGPDPSHPPPQLGVPVRLGTRLIAALVARWPADRVPPSDAAQVLELTAAVTASRLDSWLYRTRTEAEASALIPELVGVSRAISEVRQSVARAAVAPFSVLVEGESGVGKELIARAVHYLSPRRERRFCDVNCAALPDELVESELFGHAKGAFTGAVADRPGLFEEAHGGTLFLDEIADLSLRAQAKLLRVVQQQEIRRVGEMFARPVDVRLVAAANRDMRSEAANGRFRQDLLYRLDVVRIAVPALRERPEDIPALAQHFWRTAAARVGTTASLSPAVLAGLSGYHWPGNVRELQNVIAALAVAAPRRGRVGADVLPAVISGAMPVLTSRLAEARLQFERRFVEVALARTGGNRARTARTLGLSRQGLLKLMDRLGIDR